MLPYRSSRVNLRFKFFSKGVSLSSTNFSSIFSNRNGGGAGLHDGRTEGANQNVKPKAMRRKLGQVKRLGQIFDTALNVIQAEE